MQYDFQPENTQLPNTHSSVDTSTYDFQPEQPQASAPLLSESKTFGQTLKGMGLSALGNMSQVGSAIGQGVYDLGSYIDKNIGLISPAEAALGEQKVKEFFDKGRVSETGDQTDMFNKAYQEHPYIGNAARYGLGTGIALAANPGSPFTSTVGNIATRAGINALQGGIAADNGNQGLGLGLGAIGSVLGDAIAKGASSVASQALSAFQNIKKWIQPVQKAVSESQNITKDLLQSEATRTTNILKQSDQNWSKIDAIPGTINGQPIIRNAQNIISNSRLEMPTSEEQISSLGSNKANESLLNQKQLNVLIGIQKQAANLTNMQQARLLKQDISNNYSLFSGKGIDSDLKTAYVNLKQQVDTALKLKAKEAGLDKEYQFANEFHQTNVVPLKEDGAIDRLNALQQQEKLEQFNKQNPNFNGSQSPNYTQALNTVLPKTLTPATLEQKMQQFDSTGKSMVEKVFINKTFNNVNFTDPMTNNFTGQIGTLNKTINEYKDTISPQGIKTLQGLKQVLTQAQEAKKYLNQGGGQYFQHRLGHAIGEVGAGAAIGGGLAYEGGGNWKAGALAGAIGVGALPIALHSMKQMLDTTYGHYFLGKLANPENARAFLRLFTNAPLAQLDKGTDENP